MAKRNQRFLKIVNTFRALCMLSTHTYAQSCLTLCNPMDYIACQAPLFMGFSRQKYWSGLPCPPPGALLNPGIELEGPESPASPALGGGFFTTSANWEA